MYVPVASAAEDTSSVIHLGGRCPGVVRSNLNCGDRTTAQTIGPEKLNVVDYRERLLIKT